MDRLKQIESFAAVAAKGSLTAAAQAEGVAPAQHTVGMQHGQQVGGRGGAQGEMELHFHQACVARDVAQSRAFRQRQIDETARLREMRIVEQVFRPRDRRERQAEPL